MRAVEINFVFQKRATTLDIALVTKGGWRWFEFQYFFGKYLI